MDWSTIILIHDLVLHTYLHFVGIFKVLIYLKIMSYKRKKEIFFKENISELYTTILKFR